MARPTPTKPPRGIKYGKDEPGCGLLVNVIKSLGFSETNEEKQKEKQKIEKEFMKSDQCLSELISKHDSDLTRVLPLFGQITSQITISREKIHVLKENLIVCKRLLECRRDELMKLWVDAIQHKAVLEMLEQINEINKVPLLVTSYMLKRNYLHATKTLTKAISLSDGDLQNVEGLSDLRNDLKIRKMQLYNKLCEELDQHLYKISENEILTKLQSQNSNYNNITFQFQRNFTRKSIDKVEANERVRKALNDMTQGLDIEKTDIVIESELLDEDLCRMYFVSTIVECFALLGKVPESVEKIKTEMQSKLLQTATTTTQQIATLNIFEINQHPLLTLLEIIFKQFKLIAQTHSLLLKNFLNVTQRYNTSVALYDLLHFWTQAQIVFQIILTDYLDIQNVSDEERDQLSFSELTKDVNSFFRRKKSQSKKTLFKFDRASHVTKQESFSMKEHRRNPSDISNDENLTLNDHGKDSKKQEKILVCKPDPSLIRIIYLPLLSYIHEIELFMKCKSGQPCILSTFISNYVKEVFLAKGHKRNLEITIDSISKNQETWRAVISPEKMKQLKVQRPLLQSTVLVEQRVVETKKLIQDLPTYSEDLLTMICKLLKTYREKCQAVYLEIVQPDTEGKRIYSVAWLKDEDINRFLKTLPNWTDLKTSSKGIKVGRKLQRSNFEPSEEESPLQIQQRNIREAEMLTSNLGEGGISQQEILGDISVLKELAILQESMEWFSSKISEFASDLRRPILNNSDVMPGFDYPLTVNDGTIKVLTNLALEFDELANTCLLVLHLEIRVQCFYYLRSTDKQKEKLNSFISTKDDVLEPDTQVTKLTKVLSEMDEVFCSTLHPRKTKYIFEGLAHLAAKILIQASNYVETIDQVNIQRMCRNAITLQQTLGGITASREVALDQAKNFYELLCLKPDKILSQIIEKGSQFTEMQYLNALNLSSKAHGITDPNLIASYQQRLSDILSIKAPNENKIA